MKISITNFIIFLLILSCSKSALRTNENILIDNITTNNKDETTLSNIINYELKGKKTSIRTSSNLYPFIEVLSFKELQDLTLLENDKSITALDFHLGSFSDLSPLGEFTQLEALFMRYNSHINDLSPLMMLKNLRIFEICDYDSVIDISPLAGLTEMRYLFMQFENLNETNCVELINMKNLEELYFSIGNIISAKNISSLINLKDLSLDVSCINDDSISTLANLTNLQSLELFGVRYTDTVDNSNIKPLNLDWIPSLNKLESIRLEGFDIKDISPLEKLPNLIYIDVNRSRVHDYYPLVNCKSLKSILTPLLRGFDSDDYSYSNYYEYQKYFETFTMQTLNDLKELFDKKEISFRYPYDR